MYEGPLLNLYGASEVGVLFMEGEDGRLHHCPLTTHVELLPVKVATPGATNVALAVVTTVDRAVQPLVRFVVGDSVSVDPLFSVEVHDRIAARVGRGACDRRRRPARWGDRHGGRDCRALAPALGVAVYQANQPAHGQVHVDIVSDAGDTVIAEAEARLSPLFEGMELKSAARPRSPLEPSGKFRVDGHHFPIAMGPLFDGCDGVMLASAADRAIVDATAGRDRSEFPLLERELSGNPLVFLDSASTTPKPQAVIPTPSCTTTRPRPRTFTAGCTRSAKRRRSSTMRRASRSPG